MRYLSIIFITMLACSMASCGEGWSINRGKRWQWHQDKEMPITEQADGEQANGEQIDGSQDVPDAAADEADGRTDRPVEVARPVAAPSGPTQPATQWPTGDARGTQAPPTPAPRPASVSSASPAAGPSAPQSDIPAASPSTEPSRIERVMADGIAERPTRRTDPTARAEPPTPQPRPDAAPSRPARIVAERPTRPPRLAAEPSQLPQGRPPQETQPTDLADTQEPDETTPPPTDAISVDAANGEAEMDPIVPAPRNAEPVRQDATETVIASSMVQVNDAFITIDDVLTGLHAKLVDLQVDDEDTFRQAVVPLIEQELRQQIYESLVLGEAEANLTEPQKAIIADEIADARREMIAHAGGSEQALEQYHRDRNTTLAKVLDEHWRRLTGRLYLQSRIEPSISITRKMLLDYYHKHADDYVVAKHVQMQIIAAPFKKFLPETSGLEPTPQEWKLARNRARTEIDAAAAAVVAGEDFGEVVEEYSRGLRAKDSGIWPSMAAGSFRDTEVERNAFALDEGDICGVIATEDGYYIVKALKVELGQSVSFADAQEQIEEILRSQQYDDLASEYFMKLFSEATISQSDDFMETTINGAVSRYWYAD